MPDLRPTLIRPDWGVRFGRSVRLSVVVLGLGLIVLQLHPATGLAECDPDDDACLEQEGDNDADVDIDSEGQGGDAIAGSQVISVAGGGDTQIEANNQSRFARAKGGDVEGNVETTVNNGPRLEVEPGSSDTSVVSSGVAQVDQNATPRVGITLDQVSVPTGTAGLSNTAFATTFATGTNVVSQAPLGVGSVTQVVDQAAETPVMSSVMPEIGISSDNVSFVTGVAPVTQSATARVTPAALAFGGGGSASAVVTASVPITQEASPSVALSLDQVASPSGLSVISTSARSIVDLDARNDAIGVAGPVSQSITQSGSSSVTNTVTPVIDVTTENTATIIGSSPVNQQATGVASPTATAIGGLGDGVSAALFQIGDNVESVDVDFALVGGDAIAGSNVIAVAGAGDTTVVATNDSVFASAEGGDTVSIAHSSIDNGPRLAVSGGGSSGSANALGTGTQAQTAGPSFAGPRADPDAAPRLGSVLTTVLTRTGVPTTP